MNEQTGPTLAAPQGTDRGGGRPFRPTTWRRRSGVFHHDVDVWCGERWPIRPGLSSDPTGFYSFVLGDSDVGAVSFVLIDVVVVGQTGVDLSQMRHFQFFQSTTESLDFTIGRRQLKHDVRTTSA